MFVDYFLTYSPSNDLEACRKRFVIEINNFFWDISLSQVDGITKLKQCEPIIIKVLGPYTFSIVNTLDFSNYVRCGIVIQVKKLKVSKVQDAGRGRKLARVFYVRLKQVRSIAEYQHHIYDFVALQLCQRQEQASRTCLNFSKVSTG